MRNARLFTSLLFPLLVGLAASACQSGQEPASPPANTAAGSVRFKLALSAPSGAKAVRVSVVGNGIEAQQTVAFEDHAFPLAADPQAGGHGFADAFFVLPAGVYEVSAQLLDEADEPIASCTVEKRSIAIMAGATTETTLLGTCAGAKGAGLDVAVVINNQPSIDSLQIGDGKFICRHQVAPIVVGVSDGDSDPLKLSFSVTGAPAGAEDHCLSFDQKLAAFAATTAGSYEITVEVTDGQAPPSKLSFPVHVSDCQAPPVCAGEAVAALVPKPEGQHGQCSCDKPAFPARLHQPKGKGYDVMPPYLENPPSVIVKRTVPKPSKGEDLCPSQGAWQGITLSIRTSKAGVTVQCGYRWTAASSPSYEPLQALSPTALACDQPAMAPTASEPTLPTEQWQRLQEIYRHRVNFHPGLGGLSPQPVTVAVLDSASYGYGEDRRERFGHGRAVGRIIGDLACADPGSPTCASRIRNYLTLDRVGVGSPPDRDAGGFFADFQTLATQIHRALNDWVAEGGAAPLVINLSLGWDGRHLDHLNAFRDLRTGPDDCPRDEPALLEEVVRTALERASCLGALVVAAAGNEDNLGRDVGPFLPAGWEVLPALEDAAACADHLPPGWKRGAGNPSKSTAGYRPLLFAATGVGDGRMVLGNTRTAGKARLAGQGMSAITAESRSAGPAHTLHLSGSSMGTATVSGVAAAAWSLHPKADAFEVMDWLYGTGVVTFKFTGAVDLLDYADADFKRDGCSDHTCFRTHTVQHCPALAAALAARGGQSLACPPAASEPALPEPPAGVRTGDEADAAAAPLPTPEMPVWGIHMAPWIRPAPEPFGCLPGYCTLDIYNFGYRFGYFGGSFDAAVYGKIFATQLHLHRPFAPVDTRLVFHDSIAGAAVPADGLRFLVYLTGVDNLYVASITNWVYAINGSGLLTHGEVIAVINR